MRTSIRPRYEARAFGFIGIPLAYHRSTMSVTAVVPSQVEEPVTLAGLMFEVRRIHPRDWRTRVSSLREPHERVGRTLG
jgi:hypothetical protein